MSSGTNKVQGEGDYESAREYNKDTREFIESGKVEEKAEEAKRARQGSERAELDKAEEKGKARSRGEDPALKK